MKRRDLLRHLEDQGCCIATRATEAQAEAELRDAIAFHIEGLREDGLPVPVPTSRVEYIDV